MVSEKGICADKPVTRHSEVESRVSSQSRKTFPFDADDPPHCGSPDHCRSCRLEETQANKDNPMIRLSFAVLLVSASTAAAQPVVCTRLNAYSSYVAEMNSVDACVKWNKDLWEIITTKTYFSSRGDTILVVHDKDGNKLFEQQCDISYVCK